MATIKEDISRSADWIAHALSSSGYRADFTPQSLWDIDRFFDDHSSEGAAKPGGEWIGNDEDPQAEMTVELRFIDGTRCWPVVRAMKRFKNGAEDSIAAWG